MLRRFKVPGSRFTVAGRTDSRLIAVNLEPGTILFSVVLNAEICGMIKTFG